MKVIWKDGHAITYTIFDNYRDVLIGRIVLRPDKYKDAYFYDPQIFEVLTPAEAPTRIATTSAGI